MENLVIHFPFFDKCLIVNKYENLIYTKYMFHI
nr:MAG TPA: hypothetical protein [Caudoviricetes sp.]